MMSDQLADQDEDHADNIIAVQTYEASMPPQGAKLNFEGWHRPRKQYVRSYQWGREIGRIIEAQGIKKNALKYLGLPALDLLDLRHFHAAVCEPNSLRLRFLGFNSKVRQNKAAETALNVSMHEVKSLCNVDPLSEIISDDFKQLANLKSIAFQKACELGPYDIINLDLCDGFGAGEPGVMHSSYYTAVNNLLGIQARSPDPWLFFLTTRVDRPNIHEGVLGILVEKYCANLRDCQSFREASRDNFAVETTEAVALATDQSKGLLEIFTTGLCKWFVGLALGHSPPTSVELLSVVGYRVHKGSADEDLVSLALKFTPKNVPARDPLGLAALAPESPDEGVLATKALRKVAGRVNVDEKLALSPELFQTMTEESATLLESAGYDARRYREWVASQNVQDLIAAQAC